MITFESVSKTYRDGTSAVVDLDLEVPSGQITVIVGPSGCGKTTTLRMVNRMLEPTKGRITWDGTPIKSRRKTTLRRQMGYVIQSGGLFPHRTVVDNIATVPGLLGWDQTKTRNRSFELLDAVGLDRKLAQRYPAQLSGGQQQRVGVARALAADPLVLLMDEPFSAVDPVVRAELHEFFLDLQRELSKTIILITHDIDEAIKLGDQVAILRVGGKLAQVGAPQELLEHPADAFVEGFVGRDRGYRSLSFLPSTGLELDTVPLVRDAGSGSGDQPTLVVDADARPQGWVAAGRTGGIVGLGAVFDPKRDTLRAALDAALTSPHGLAVAVDRETGRYAGVAHADTILARVPDERSRTLSASGDTTSSPSTRTDDAAPAAVAAASAATVAVHDPGTTEPPAETAVDKPAPSETGGDGSESALESTADEAHAEGPPGGDVPPTAPPAAREASDEPASFESRPDESDPAVTATEPDSGSSADDPPAPHADEGDAISAAPAEDAPFAPAEGQAEEERAAADDATTDAHPAPDAGPVPDTDPAPEPAPSEPAPSEPAPSEPAPSEPAPSEPAPFEPAPSEPAPFEPGGPDDDLAPPSDQIHDDHHRPHP